MKKKRFRPVYLLFLLIPFTFYFLGTIKVQEYGGESSDHFYFSAKSSSPAHISLYRGNDSLTSWMLNPGGFKYLDYLGVLQENDKLSLHIDGLGPGDTLVFLGFNRCRDNRVLSMNDRREPNCIIENAGKTENGEALYITPYTSSLPVHISIQNTAFWLKTKEIKAFRYILFFVFAGIFILILLLSPSPRYFIASCLLSLLIMLGFWQYQSKSGFLFGIETGSQTGRFEHFYNSNTCFSQAKTFTSDTASAKFCHPVDLFSDGFLRCDFDGCVHGPGQINAFLKYGFLIRHFDLNTIAPGKLVLNDLDLKNGIFTTAGNDPFIGFTSVYFQQSFQLFRLIAENLYLFISLAFFLLFLLVYPLFGRKIHDRLHPAYVLLLLIPLLWGFLYKKQNPEKESAGKDSFYFSVKAQNPCDIDVFSNGLPIASCNISPGAYRYLYFDPEILSQSCNSGILIRNLSAGDTLSIQSFNLYRNNQVFSIYNTNKYIRSVNADMVKSSNIIEIRTHADDQPVYISLPPYFSWDKTTKSSVFFFIICLACFFTLLLIYVLKPPPSYFIFSLFSALLIVLLFYFADNKISGQLALKTSPPIKGVAFYYSNIPRFNAVEVTSIFDYGCFFHTPFNPEKFSFLRFDILESTGAIQNLSIITKTGFIKQKFDVTNVAAENCLYNDILPRGNMLYICGNDPYICLATSDSVGRLEKSLICRKNLYFFVSLIFFILFLLLHPVQKKRINFRVL